MGRILFIGPISPPTSGPGIKNKEICNWLLLSQLNDSFVFINTYDFRKLRFWIIFKSLIIFFFTKKIILSVSRKGRFIFIPICFLFGKEVVLLPAGGSFDKEIRSLSNWRKKLFLKSCQCIISIKVESNILLDGLLDLGFKNVSIFPNPRKNRGINAIINEKEVFSIVFVSKIRERKGVLILIDAIDKLNAKSYNFNLKFYGYVEHTFANQFYSAISAKDYISYEGEVENEKVQRIISENDIFVLPTIYKGEGLPGALVEAAFTGIPIIVTDFRAVHEFIDNGQSGIIVPMGDSFALSEAILDLSNNIDKRQLIGNSIKSRSVKYDIDFLMENFTVELSQIGWV